MGYIGCNTQDRDARQNVPDDSQLSLTIFAKDCFKVDCSRKAVVRGGRLYTGCLLMASFDFVAVVCELEASMVDALCMLVTFHQLLYGWT